MTRARILNVDDNESGRYIKSRILRQDDYEVLEARTGIEALEVVNREKPDLVLLDVKLPDVTGYEVCRLVKKQKPALLVLQISASFVAPGDRAVGLDSGADAYLSQPVEPSELLATVRALLRLRNAEKAARESDQLYRVIVESAVDYAIVTCDLQGFVVTWSGGAEQVLGWTAQDMIGQPIDRLFTAEDLESNAPVMDRRAATQDSRTLADRWLVRKDGRQIWAGITMVPLRAELNGVTGFICILRDRTAEKTEQDAMQRSNVWLEREVAARTRALTEATEQLRREIEDRERAEQALRQAQKMEAVGQLTGGIAHDFNNMLTVVLGSTDSLKKSLPVDAGDQHRRADLIMLAATQAAALTHRLLAFSRQQPRDPKPANLNALVGGVHDMLRRTIGESIELETELEAGLPLVTVDSNQFENAILNLVVNARDAMPSGGRLTIHTDTGTSGFVTLTVADTGTGMSPEVAKRALEPFFTTKRTGVGTGLGLSQVYTFVQQSGGDITIDSVESKGTAIKLHFPALPEGVETADDERTTVESQFEGHGRVALVVEDQQGVREYVADVLRKLDFEVGAVGDAGAALRFLETSGAIDLLMTDVGLPGGIDGWRLAAAVREIVPEVKTIFMTGYAMPSPEPLGANSELLMKPFVQSTLEGRLLRLFGT
jgi:PAS domain S-box-containing protein